MRALACAALFLSALRAAAQDPAPPPDALEDRLKTAAEKGESVETGVDFIGERERHDGCDVTPILFPGGDVTLPMALNDSATTLWIADRTGVVRRIMLPSWREDRRFRVGEPIAGLVSCKRGVLVAMPGKSQVLMLGHDKLERLDTFRTREAQTVVVQPHGNIGFVVKSEKGIPIELDVIDAEVNRPIRPVVALEMLKAAKPYKRHATSRGLSTFENMAIPGKGDFLFCTSGDTVFRMRIDGTALAIEEAGPLCGRASALPISPDGQWIAVPAPDSPAPGLPEVKPHGSWVFRTKDLQKVEYVVSDMIVRGFTRGGEKTYGFLDSGELVVKTRQGKVVQRSPKIVERPADVRAVLAHPEGTKFIVLTQKEMLWVELK